MSIPTNASTANYVSYREERDMAQARAKRAALADRIMWAVAILAVCAGVASIVLGFL